MQSHDLIKSARDLLLASRSRPRQANLSRATSTAYYAAFHMLARHCADLVIGTSGSRRAWTQVYRALDHGAARNVRTHPAFHSFPVPIRRFTETFINLQKKRELADYDPFHRSLKSDVLTDIQQAEQSMAAFEATPVKDRRAFAVLLLMPARKPRT